MFKFFFANNPDLLNLPSKNKRTIFNTICLHGNFALVEFLIKNDEKHFIEKSRNSLIFHDLARSKDENSTKIIQTISTLFSRDDWLREDQAGFTSLHSAAQVTIRIRDQIRFTK